jgi:glycosyltransferase involved in cell wall biosynthesis
LSVSVRVHIVDPSAYTPPYDHALCRSLAAAGAQVELHTSRFAHGLLAPPVGYVRHESFYRGARLSSNPRAQRVLKLAEHVPDMLRYRRAAAGADVVHFQWLPVQPLDVHLLPRGRPLVLTAHDVLPREPRPGQLSAQRRAYERVAAVVVHSEHGRARLTGELGLDPEHVHVIRHGVLRPWEGQEEQPLPPELAGAAAGQLPVVLFFGLLRPYKGLDLLLEAWREVSDAELWVVGKPRVDLAGLRVAEPPGVRWLTRFVSDGEMLALMRRASLAVLPYREIDQSGVAFTALGAGLPLLLSDVGGFPELVATGAARTFPSGDATVLAEQLQILIGDPSALQSMAAAAAHADEELSWTDIAARTMALYEDLLAAS